MKIVKNLFKVLLGLSLGLALAEFAFRLRDDAAFPHLNIYLQDDKQGVRLEPNAELKLRVADNALTTVRTNSKGFRGADWPAPTPGEVLVVGDSQVFGLGVEDGETFSAKLAEQLKVPVLNAGTPTWAVRMETAPKEVSDFPFRKTLMSRSHLVFGLRKLMHAKADADDGFASEGTWRDLVSASDQMKTEAADEPMRKFLAARARLDNQFSGIADRLEAHLEEKIYDDEELAEALNARARPNGDPRDIFDEGGEGDRSVNSTVMHLLAAAMNDGRNEAFLTQLAQEKNDAELKKLLEERKALRAEVYALKAEAAVKHEIPLDRVLARTKAACDAVGARLVVVGLPLDVMVSAEEWKKYGAKPIDLAPTAALRSGLILRVEAVGAEGADPTEALAAAEPGAFLNKDLHLSPKGHAAFAEFLAKVVKEPRKKTLLTLPEGRSYPPTEDEWVAATECNVKGSSAAKCATKLVREWLLVDCGNGDDPLESVYLQTGGHGDARIGNQRLLIPVLEGDATRAQFHWAKTWRELQLDFPKGGKLSMAFVNLKREGDARSTSTQDANDPLSEVSCPPDQRVGGALRRCSPACDEKTPCKEGHCEPWPTGSFCAVP